MKKYKKFITSAVLAVSILAMSTSAMATNYIRDIDWSKIKCVHIPELVDKLNNLADFLQDQADSASAAGNDGMAAAYEAAAAEATVEASIGVFHYSSGDCVQ